MFNSNDDRNAKQYLKNAMSGADPEAFMRAHGIPLLTLEDVREIRKSTGRQPQPTSCLGSSSLSSAHQITFYPLVNEALLASGGWKGGTVDIAGVES